MHAQCFSTGDRWQLGADLAGEAAVQRTAAVLATWPFGHAQHPPGLTLPPPCPALPRHSIEAISYMLTQQLAAELAAQRSAGSKGGGAAEAAAPAGASKL